MSHRLSRRIRSFFVAERDPLLHSVDLESYTNGELSVATVQANHVMEDLFRVEKGPGFLFVGIFDGHGGPEASRHVRDALFADFVAAARAHRTISNAVLQDAIDETEQRFMSVVRETFRRNRSIAATGSCCLVGVIWNRKLYIANLGNSRAILWTSSGSDEVRLLAVKQLTEDHDVFNFSEVEQISRDHPHERLPRNPDFVKRIDGLWKIFGVSEVTRAIGHAALKDSRFIPIDDERYRFTRNFLPAPAIYDFPDVFSGVVSDGDRFLIFASSGLWKWLGNEEAALIVHEQPRKGIARKLVEAAVTKALEGRSGDITKLADLMKIDRGERRSFHDDIVVAVVFLDHGKAEEEDVSVSTLLNFFQDVGEASSSEVHPPIGLQQ